jgi:hypothetical protein
MNDFERERRKLQKVRNCMSGSLALGALGCELTRLRRKLETRELDFDKWDFRKASRLAADVRKAFGGKSHEAMEIARAFKEIEETGTNRQFLDSIIKAQEVLPKIAASASDQCGRALRPPAVRKPKESQAPPIEANP